MTDNYHHWLHLTISIAVLLDEKLIEQDTWESLSRRLDQIKQACCDADERARQSKKKKKKETSCG